MENNLRTAVTKSCGCLQKQKAAHTSKTHGDSKTRLYRIYAGMLNRCLNKNNKGYENYGGRGVLVCAEWLNSYEVFKAWALAAGYTAKLTIERKDNEGGYSPENCVWATSKEQNRNRRSSHNLTAFGETKPIAAWLEDPRCKIRVSSLYRRLNAGMSPSDALSASPKTGKHAHTQYI